MNYAVYIKQGLMGICLEEALPKIVHVVTTGTYESCLTVYESSTHKKVEHCWNPHTNQKQLISNIQYV